MGYVDGFVLSVPKDRFDEYKELAEMSCKAWLEHGALSYVEARGDDVPYGELTSFPRAVEAKPDDIVIFAWITYASRADRDAVNAKVMADPRMKHTMETMPFDAKRMIYGGFETFIDDAA